MLQLRQFCQKLIHFPKKSEGKDQQPGNNLSSGRSLWLLTDSLGKNQFVQIVMSLDDFTFTLKAHFIPTWIFKNLRNVQSVIIA